MRGPLGLNRGPRTFEPRPPHVGRRAAAAKVAHLVELLVEGKHLFEHRSRHLRGIAGIVSGATRVLCPWRKPFEPEEVLRARDRIAKRAIRIVQVRGPFEARATLGW